MENINIAKQQKFQTIVDRLRRGIDIGAKGRCQKSIFVHRYFRFLNNRCFKLLVKDRIYYGMFVEHKIKVSNGTRYEHHGVEFALGYSLSRYRLSFLNERHEFENLELHYNDILEIKYEEIERERYYEISSLFINVESNTILK
jgi:hypothetical protein